MELARAALAQVARFRDAVREGAQSERGRLRIGLVGSARFALLPRILPAFRHRFPSGELTLEEGTRDLRRARRAENRDRLIEPRQQTALTLAS